MQYSSLAHVSATPSASASTHHTESATPEAGPALDGTTTNLNQPPHPSIVFSEKSVSPSASASPRQSIWPSASLAASATQPKLTNPTKLTNDTLATGNHSTALSSRAVGTSCAVFWWKPCFESEASQGLGSAASGGQSAGSQLLPGAWCDGCSLANEPPNSMNPYGVPSVLLCPRYGACEAGGPTGAGVRCASGHTGAACSACMSGYAAVDSSPCAPCQQCQDDSGIVTPQIVLAAVIALLIAGVTAASALAAHKRGSLDSDLLVGALRTLGVYISLMAYVSIAFAEHNEQHLGVASRAVTLQHWQQACGRSTQQVRSLSAMAANASGQWLSDASLYGQMAAGDDSDALGSAMSGAFTTAASATGSLPVGDVANLDCALGHNGFATQVQGTLLAQAALMLVAAAAMVLVACLLPTTAPATGAASGRAGPRSASPDKLTVNPTAKATSTRQPQAHTSSGDTSAPSHSTWSCAVAGWTAARVALSLYLMLRGSAIAASLQLMAPTLSTSGGTQWLLASHLSSSMSDSAIGGLWEMALVSLLLHGLVVPLGAMVALRRTAAHLLNVQHHASVTWSVLTEGYRLQLSPEQAAVVSRRAAAVITSHGSHANLLPVLRACQLRRPRLCSWRQWPSLCA